MPAKPFKLSLKVVIFNSQNQVLLIRRSLQSQGNPGKWDLPGGKIETGEDFFAGLVREVAEETGLTIALEHVLGATEFDLPDRMVATMIMRGSYLAGEVRLSSEHIDHAWIDASQLAETDLPVQLKKFCRELNR
jgi:8-oxo-dGTP diphosphatase